MGPFKVGPKPPHVFRSDLSGATAPAIVFAAGSNRSPIWPSLLRPSVGSGPGHYKLPGRVCCNL